MKELILNELRREYAVRERDVGPYAVLKKSGMTFRISAYEIEGLGSMSTIDMSAMLGLMRMESFILTAEQKDLPIYSGDFIQAAGKCTLLEEFYDNMIAPPDEASVREYRQVKDRYADLSPYETAPRWYDGIRYDFTLGVTDKRLKTRKEEITAAYFAAYRANIGRAAAVDPTEKKAKTAAYVDGLFSNGGPAVDQFKKLFGTETAREIFEKYVFSCK
jgi:hypothetical protein